MNAYGVEFKNGDVISYCDEQFEVIENYGSSGTVREFLGEDRYGDTIRNFRWEVYGEKCKKIK
ncbi:hypothetical protein [Paenibacillus sp. ISL-20]|uniref:hypothetical protein n=1 Tax=Paenibacillus sp. ISL-20 TaxID=2819163 RepID=UPI001BEAF086|nr:hypothetical protein [Paenibacillus sp. ISL-20]MBT2759947.1 hypothetical protein [Paenibacillus sp. ISL-20]